MHNILNEFIFGVMAYNEELEIVPTLESIKYQIEHYGNGINVHLLIVDDCSKDNTKKAIDNWIDKNSTIFSSVNKQYNTKNKGTVVNYNYLLSIIKNRPFKIIAGDDLISKVNIFAKYNAISGKQLYCGFKFMFNDQGVYIDETFAKMQFALSRIKPNRNYLLRLLKCGFLICSPETLYTNTLYDASGAVEYNEKFRLFEDNPTWYAMLKNRVDIDLVFDIEPIVLYRVTDNSVSNGINPIFQNEMKQLYNIYKREGNYFDRFYFSLKQRSNPLCKNVSKIIDHFYKGIFVLYTYMHYGEYKVYRSIIEGFLVDENQYLQSIMVKTKYNEL